MQLAYVAFDKKGDVITANSITTNKERIADHSRSLLEAFQDLCAHSFFVCGGAGQSIKNKLSTSTQDIDNNVKTISNWCN